MRVKTGKPFVSAVALLCLIGLLGLAGVLAAGPAAPAEAKPLEQVRRNGSLSLCANPVALPFASREPGPPGFQVELAAAVARELGLSLDVRWVWSRIGARKVDCDLLMDSIVLDKPSDDNPGHGVRLTKPYFGTGVAMVVPAGSPARRFEDLKAQGVKIGVIAGSAAHAYLDRRGLGTSSFAFEDDIVDAVARGEVGAGAVHPAYVGWYLKAHPGAAIEIPAGYAFVPELRWNVAVGLRRADDALVEAVNAALDRLIANRTVEAIYGRYGIAYQPPFTAP